MMGTSDANGNRLAFWNGTHTVGGVQVMLRTPGAALLFDFGFTPNPRASLFSGVVPVPADQRLIHYLRAGMAPLVEGIYDPDQLHGRTVAELTERLRHAGHVLSGQPLVDDLGQTPTAVFFSHLHQDHMALLPHLGEHMTVFCHRDSVALHESMVEAGTLPATPATLVGLDDGEAIEHGDIRLELVAVDHDIPGAAGFLASTPSETIAWTGDWRMHGRHPQRLERFAELCRAREDVVLLTEGTTLNPQGTGPMQGQPLGERAVIERVDEQLDHATGLASAAFYPRNLERIEDLRRVAAAHGRRFVLSRSTAAGWFGAVERGVEVGSPKDLLIHADGCDGGPWEQVTAEQIGNDKAAFFCELQIEHRAVLLDAGGGPGDVYFHTNGNPLALSGPEWDAMQAWMQQTGIRFEHLNSGGHAPPDTLAWMAQEAAPELLIPMHSGYPELYPTGGVTRFLPRRGEVTDLRIAATANS